MFIRFFNRSNWPLAASGGAHQGLMRLAGEIPPSLSRSGSG